MSAPKCDASNESQKTDKAKRGKKSANQLVPATEIASDKITRPAIKSAETVDLWVMAGGRCEFCNKYLLHDEVFSLDLNLAEKAHIVGWNDTPGSPRGQDPLPLDVRNDAPNLMLLCADHHRMIDSSRYRGDFTVERLRKRKAKHEARIKFLTGLTEDQETVVLRMLGPIRDTKVEVSRQHAAAVVLKKERYPRFPLALEGQDLEIDTAKLPDPERAWEEHWAIGKIMIDGQVSKINEGLASGQIRHLSVFGLARIPLLIYLGYKIGDKIPTDIYQKQRGPEESWLWNEEATPVEFETNQIQNSSTSENVALLLSLSGSLSVSQLPSNIDDTFNIFEIRPLGVTPNRELLENQQSLVNFTKVYHHFLSGLEVTNKSSKQIHLFSAIPVSAAVACGRGLMRDAQPSILVYDRYQETYKPALNIN
jgi:hypothetical protein